ncbi:conserved protein of unknown function [Rhodovastum atsumiense]|uniref:Uncharacterized protein n=1 Tax=Rhodovastum atsumiense TaxID=504468 RepID=A0A5M6IJD0_9PROT|nr:hypothetical protein [Rhodovastum atsumiense]KAA5607939.1 hypothetical protein F1189_31455 [Rhodovastum atsumiense]CAH2603813.1 conserved protein of unknown function [Rhodovastum atsumiense]
MGEQQTPLDAFQTHMNRCMAAVLAPMRRPDIRVTIIVRAPEALPEEAMISTNDDLSVVRDAVVHFAERSNG